MTDLKLKGKKALVTGGTSGMGRAASLLFAEEGIDLAINYSKDDQKANSLMEEIKGKSGKVLLVKGDISDYAATEEIVKKVQVNFGRIDILVHSAGIAQLSPDTPENWDRVMKVHLYSTYNLGKTVVPIMKEHQSGKIVIVSSLAAHSCGANAYGCAMAGKTCYAKGLARELGPHNINVNTVSPGQIFTPMLDPFISPEKRREFAEKNIPLYKNKPGYPEGEEVARVILFLVSDLARHITGEDIKIDGGQFIHF